MRFSFFLLLFSFFASIVLCGFQCGRQPELCDRYTNDSIQFGYDVTNHTNMQVFDTLQLQATINDSILTVNQLWFVEPLTTFACTVQAYKVLMYNGAPMLQYANIEFNPVVYQGQYDVSSSNGFSFIFNRLQPYNLLRSGFVAGRPGLYLFKIQSRPNYYYYENIYVNGYPCTQFRTSSFIDEPTQGKQYWTSLGTTSLRLLGGGINAIVNKDDRDYFFVAVQ